MKRDLSLSMGICHRVDRDDSCTSDCPACAVLKIIDTRDRQAAKIQKLREVEKWARKFVELAGSNENTPGPCEQGLRAALGAVKKKGKR